MLWQTILGWAMSLVIPASLTVALILIYRIMAREDKDDK